MTTSCLYLGLKQNRTLEKQVQQHAFWHPLALLVMLVLVDAKNLCYKYCNMHSIAHQHFLILT